MLAALALLIAISALSPAAHAQSSGVGWHSGIEGDPRSVGRGGSGVVLSDNLWGVFENPAGSALTVGGTMVQFSDNRIEDQEQLTSDLQIRTGGVVAPETPWGFAAGVSEFVQASLVREWSLSASRLFASDRLSVGAALNYGHSFSANPGFADSVAWGTTLGGLYRFNKRMIVGVTARTRMSYVADDASRFAHPWSLGFGIGQVPNRFFRYEMGIRLFGASLAGDPFYTAEPHAGAEYEFVSLRQLQLKAFGGGYLEKGRIHGTLGASVDFWVFSLSFAVDGSRGYKNYLFGLGVDLGRTLKKLKIMPSSVPAPPGGLLPRPFEANDDWFPPRMQDDPENSFQEIGPTAERWKNRLEDPSRISKDGGKAIDDETQSFDKDWQDVKEDLK